MKMSFNNAGFLQITASCSNKKINFQSWGFFAERNNILIPESLCTMQVTIFVYDANELLFGYTELSPSAVCQHKRGNAARVYLPKFHLKTRGRFYTAYVFLKIRNSCFLLFLLNYHACLKQKSQTC